MVVFALILLFFGATRTSSVLTTTAGIETPETGGYLPVFAIAMFMSPVRRLRLRHGRDLRRGDHRREPPGAARHPLGDLALRRRRARSSCSAIILAMPGHARPRSQDPFADRDGDQGRASATRSATIYLLRDPRRRLRLHDWRSRARPTRLMFSMGRDRRMPLGGVWGQVNSDVQDPGQRRRSRSASSRRSRSS